MDFETFVRQSGHVTHEYTVTPDVYYSFQRCSNDYNPLHTDEQWARRNGFPACVMYGNILNAFISHFVGMLLPSRHVMIQTQDVAFHKPVFLNDKLSMDASIETTSEAVGIVNYKLVFRRIGGGKNTLVAKGHVQIGLLKEMEA